MSFQFQMLAVSGLIGLLVVLVLVHRQFGLFPSRRDPRPGKVMVLRESLALDPRRRVHLIECGQRQVLVLTGGGQDLVIGWMQDS